VSTVDWELVLASEPKKAPQAPGYGRDMVDWNAVLGSASQQAPFPSIWDTGSAPPGREEEQVAGIRQERGPEEEPLSLLGKALRVKQDAEVATMKGVVGVPQALTGMADLLPGPFVTGINMMTDKPAFGLAGWAQERLGIDYKTTQEILQDAYSEETKTAHQKVSDAEGVLGKLDAAVRNPSTILTTVLESAPLMLASSAVGVSLKTAGLVTKARYGAAIGEGLISAGAGAEQTRGESPGGRLTAKQAAIHAGSGVLTGLLGLLGGKVAQKLGLDDIDVLLTKGLGEQVKRNVLFRVIAGALIEGGVEESPQSIQEQMASNLAAGKPLLDGWDDALVMGAIIGGVMGGGVNLGSAPRGFDALKAKIDEGDHVSRKEGEQLGLSEDELRNKFTRTDAAKKRLGLTEEAQQPQPLVDEAQQPQPPVDAVAVPEDRIEISGEEGPRTPRRQRGQFVRWGGETRKVASTTPGGQLVQLEGVKQSVPATETVLVTPEQGLANQERRAWLGREEGRTATQLHEELGQAFQILEIEGKEDLSPERLEAKHKTAAKKARPEAGRSMEAAKKVSKAVGLLREMPTLAKEKLTKLEDTPTAVEEFLDEPLASEPVAEKLEQITSQTPQEATGEPPSQTAPRRPQKGVATREQQEKRIYEVFSGAHVEPSETGGWYVRIGDSYLQIEQGDIPIDRQKYEAEYGKVSDEKFATIKAAGSFSLTTPEGKRHSGFGLIRMAEGLDDAQFGKKLRHEAWHLAETMPGVILSERQWNALAEEHAPELVAQGASRARIGGKIAKALESVDPKKDSTWQKIASSLRRMIAKLIPITRYKAADLHRKMDEAGFWAAARREKQVGTQEERYALRKPEPGRAIPATDPEVRAHIEKQDAAELYEERPEAEVQAEAAQRLSEDYEGEKAKLLKRASRGASFSDVETSMAKTIINREGKQALASSDLGMIAKFNSFVAGYRRSRRETARALRQGYDPIESPAQRAVRLLTEAIIAPKEEVRKRIEKAHDRGDHKEAARLTDEAAKDYEKIKAYLDLLGIDVTDLFAGGYSDTAAARILRTIRPVKTGLGDKYYELFNNSILSGPTTHAANIIGNSTYGVYRLTAKRFVEAGFNRVLKRPEGAQLGEFTHMLAGILPGLSLAAQNFLRAWDTEQSTLEQQLGYSDISKVEETPGAIGPGWKIIPGNLGRGVRMPWRMLRAADDFAKTLVATIEVGAFAYREAKALGLEGEQMQAYISQSMRNSDSSAWSSAYESALESAFQAKGGEGIQKVKKVALEARGIMGVRYVLPFVNTPANIFATGVRQTPIGALATAKLMLNNRKEGKPLLHDTSERAAEHLLSMAVILALLANDEDDPWITGAEKTLSPKGRQEGHSTYEPLSIKISGRWFDYSRLEPFATILGLTVDGVNGFRRGEPTVMVDSLLGQMQNKTFLNGLGDMLNILAAAFRDDNQPGVSEEVAKYVSRLGASWVPNIFRMASREASDTYANRRVWGKGVEYWKRLGKRTIQGTELRLLKDYPIYNAWGKPARRSQVPYMSDWLYRISIPVKTKEEDIFIADRLILNWNNANPGDEERYPQAPPRHYRQEGETVYWTDEQYADLCKLSGELAVQMVQRIDLNPDKPTEKQIELIDKVMRRARAIAKYRVLQGD